MPSGYLMDAVGRKMVLLSSGVLLFCSWVLAAVAWSPLHLYVARLLGGVGHGVATTVVPMYTGEIASASVRGRLSTLFTGMLWSGVVLQFIVGPNVSFKMLAILSGIPPIIFLCSFVFMPESPYFLLMKGRDESAGKSLQWFRNSSNPKRHDVNTVESSEKELNEMKETVQEEMKNEGHYYDLLVTRGNRRATCIVLVISAFQRLSGIGAILAYTSTTLPAIEGFLGSSQLMICLGCVLTVSNFLSLPLIDRLGRRPLLLFSGSGNCVSMGVTAVFYFLHRETDVDTSSYTWIPYVCLLCFGVSHPMGLGIVPHTLLSELFPSHVKGVAAATTSIVLGLASFFITKAYSTIDIHLGVYVNFVIFSVNGFLSAAFTYFYIFETKGKSFAEIQRLLRQCN